MTDLDEQDATIFEAAAQQSGTSDPDAGDPNYVGDRPDVFAACRWCEEEFETLTAERSHECSERRRHSRWKPEETIPTIRPGTHELGAHVLFADEDHGLSPFFAVANAFDDVINQRVDLFEFDDEDWTFWYKDDGPESDSSGCKYWEGKIAARLEDSFEANNEYQIKVVQEDDVERRYANFQFRPSLPDPMHVDTGDPIQSLPDDLPEGVRVQVDSANLDPDEVLELLRTVAEHLDVNTDYFGDDQIHPWSRCYNLAQYVRTKREISEEKITNVDGLLDQLARFGRQSGGRGEYVWDNVEIQGHRNAVAMDEMTWEKLMAGRTREIATLIKSYHMQDPNKVPQRVTDHPKLEVQYSTEYSERGTIPWTAEEDGVFDVRDLQRELDENLVNALHWAGLDTRANPDHYVPDQYWDVTEDEREVALHECPFDALEEIEGDIATQHFNRPDATDAERDVLRAFADGGMLTYEEAAVRSDTSTSTVSRAVQRFESVLAKMGSKVGLEDDVVRTKVQQLFESVERAVKYVDRSLSDVVDEMDVLKTEDTPFARWMRKYGVTGGEKRDGLELEITAGKMSKYDVQRILRQGLDAARATGSHVVETVLESELTWHSLSEGRRTEVSPFTFAGGVVRILGNPTR
ncbi:hypothetical protein [Halostella sp. PRR32]|uniref:DUF7845 domain-containing protein n=1 Tax=Halostella sp. PRR32 TaxID=3098147 RepID=UPI002B1DA2B4|nr:hypothetical protein [Halostella sp. PRR32]